MEPSNEFDKAGDIFPDSNKLEWAVLLKASHGHGNRPALHDSEVLAFSRLTTLGSFRSEVEMELVDTDRRLRDSPNFGGIDPEIVRLQEVGLIAKDPDDFWHATSAGEQRLEELSQVIWPRSLAVNPYDS